MRFFVIFGKTFELLNEQIFPSELNLGNLKHPYFKLLSKELD